MTKSILLALAVAGAAAIAQAQPAGGPQIAPGAAVPPAESLNALVSMAEGQMVGLVKAMPADQFGFAPSAGVFVSSQKTAYGGVRTFAALVTHTAQANYGLGQRIGGPKPEVDMAGLAKLTEKEQVVAALEASFAYVHAAIGTLTPENAFQSVRGPMTRATQAAFVAMHCADEYGQMVEYARMNGVVPPASERRSK